MMSLIITGNEDAGLPIKPVTRANRAIIIGKLVGTPITRNSLILV
jgi:hypothetical protein